MIKKKTQFKTDIHISHNKDPYFCCLCLIQSVYSFSTNRNKAIMLLLALTPHTHTYTLSITLCNINKFIKFLNNRKTTSPEHKY